MFEAIKRRAKQPSTYVGLFMIAVAIANHDTETMVRLTTELVAGVGMVAVDA